MLRDREEKDVKKAELCAVERLNKCIENRLKPFVLISTGELMEGEFPPKAKALVKEFVLKYQKELNHMWETEQYIKMPPLV